MVVCENLGNLEKTIVARLNLGYCLMRMDDSDEAGVVLSQAASEAASIGAHGYVETANSFLGSLKQSSSDAQRRKRRRRKITRGSMMQVIRITFALLLLGVTACGSGEDDVARTSPEVLTEALASAEAGTTIHLEATTYAGSYQIPAGVTLQGIDGTVIAPPPGGLGISLVPGSDTQPTSLKAVRIESDGIGFHSAGSGHIAEDVYVHSLRVSLRC